MRFSCDSCGAQYMISDEKVGPKGVRVRCKKCSHVVLVKRAPAVEEVAPPAPMPPPPVESAAAPTRDAPPETTLERELGTAFENVFGGGSPGLAAEERSASEGEPGPVVPAAPTPASPTSDEGAPAATTVSEWYVAIDDRQVGPLLAEAVKVRWEAGEIGPDTLAWRPGMTDWVAISTIPEMAQYLAPVPRGARHAPTPSPAPEPPPSSPTLTLEPPTSPVPASSVANGTQTSHDVSWTPSAASALAALANQEIASLKRPESSELALDMKGTTLVDRMGLPEGGVDPTNVLPLTLKGLETTTSEAALKPAPAPAPGTTEIRRLQRKATRSVVLVGVLMMVLLAVAAAVAWKFLLRPGLPLAPVAQAPTAAAPAPAPEPAPAPPAVAASAPTPAPAPPAASSPPAAPPPVAAAAEPPPAPPPAEAAAPPAPAPSPEPAPTPPPRKKPARARAEADAPKAPKRVPPRVAAAQPAAAPSEKVYEPPAKAQGGDPLLDVAGDDEIEKELAGKAPKRSVYVPPAPGGDLPDKVSISQINEAVAGQKAALVHCTDQQRAASPDATGTLRMRWIISADGSVRDVRVVSEEFARQPIAACITSVVKGTRFPQSRTTGQEVIFPFKF